MKATNIETGLNKSTITKLEDQIPYLADATKDKITVMEEYMSTNTSNKDKELDRDLKKKLDGEVSSLADAKIKRKVW